MAKGRKPAIDGLARPQGIIDDVIYPIVTRVACSKTAKKVTGGSSRKIARKVTERRWANYENKGDRFLDKAMKREKAGKSYRRFDTKAEKNWDKSTALERVLLEGGPRDAKFDNEYVRRLVRAGNASRKAQKGRYNR